MDAWVRSRGHGPENSSRSVTPIASGMEMIKPSPSPPETMAIASSGEKLRACSVTIAGEKTS